MRNRYQQWMYDWETRLTMRDTNRVLRPLEWGLDWARSWPIRNGSAKEREEQAYLAELNRAVVEQSDDFFSYRTPQDFRVETIEVPRGKHDHRRERVRFLRFFSPVVTPYPENNLVSARWFPARGRRAVVILPQWNSDLWGHHGLCRILNVLGVAALRLSMPYHDLRMPPELERADYAVSANLGRTIAAGRQAVVDVRCCLDWLEAEGYRELGIIGTSLGSCYAFLASAHDRRLRVNAFNHASTYFGDVVWTGQSTRHIRAELESHMTMERLRALWLAISPMSYFDKFARFPKKSLVIYARYDLTFLPEFSRQVVEQFKRRNLDFSVKVLPCGHYTTGQTPFKFLDAFHLARFLGSAF